MNEVQEQIKSNFKRWDFPLGPFLSSEDVWQEMEQFAKQLGNAHIHDFVQTLMWMIDNDFPHVKVVYEFVDLYACNSEVLAEALLKNITPEGPELIVEILGSTKSQNAVKVLGQMIPVDATKPELLIALISTLGEIGGEEAILILNRIKKLQITGEVLEELNIAFRIIELGKVDYIAR